jgi:sortase A
MSRKEKIRFLVLRTIGNFFILFTIFGFLATFGPALYFEVHFRIANAFGVKYTVQNQKVSDSFGQVLARQKARDAGQNSADLFGAILNNQHTQVLVPPSTEFSLIIPKIGASEAVTENVDPSDPNAYLPVLQHSLAQAKGSAFPGMNGNIYIFAHSTDNFWDVGRYNAVFYLLKDLKPGDQVIVYFQSKRYNYTVYDSKIVDTDQVGEINANIGSGERLTLQTCWPPGTSWKRLLVYAKPSGS